MKTIKKIILLLLFVGMNAICFGQIDQGSIISGDVLTSGCTNLSFETKYDAMTVNQMNCRVVNHDPAEWRWLTPVEAPITFNYTVTYGGGVNLSWTKHYNSKNARYLLQVVTLKDGISQPTHLEDIKDVYFCKDLGEATSYTLWNCNAGNISNFFICLIAYTHKVYNSNGDLIESQRPYWYLCSRFCNIQFVSLLQTPKPLSPVKTQAKVCPNGQPQTISIDTPPANYNLPANTSALWYKNSTDADDAPLAEGYSYTGIFTDPVDQLYVEYYYKNENCGANVYGVRVPYVITQKTNTDIITETPSAQSKVVYCKGDLTLTVPPASDPSITGVAWFTDITKPPVHYGLSYTADIQNTTQTYYLRYYKTDDCFGEYYGPFSPYTVIYNSAGVQTTPVKSVVQKSEGYLTLRIPQNQLNPDLQVYWYLSNGKHIWTGYEYESYNYFGVNTYYTTYYDLRCKKESTPQSPYIVTCVPPEMYCKKIEDPVILCNEEVIIHPEETIVIGNTNTLQGNYVWTPADGLDNPNVMRPVAQYEKIPAEPGSTFKYDYAVYDTDGKMIGSGCDAVLKCNVPALHRGTAEGIANTLSMPKLSSTLTIPVLHVSYATSGNGIIELRNVLGQTIQTKSIQGNGAVDMDISKLLSGIYLLSVYDETGNTTTQKIVLNK